jgi:quercetin dioxygenase-like cupin family protein
VYPAAETQRPRPPGNIQEEAMELFDLREEQRFDPARHVETILHRFGGGDVTVACWEPGQVSPHHAHPHATEIYYCVYGGGRMRLPDRTVDLVPGAFVLHPPGELHEYTNGPERTLLFRIRIGDDMTSIHHDRDGNPIPRRT